MWISFAWTTPALVCGYKKRTRRGWKDAHVKKFHADQMVDAYSKNPRYGGVKVADLRIARQPFLQSTSKLTREDWFLEGFEWLIRQGQKVGSKRPDQLWNEWIQDPREYWVVDFELLYLTKAGLDLRKQWNIALIL